ncbi:hypothetical protein HQN60_00055 [Deefgea piscis]|uniref:Uncharacterized protein n=1 Tax=Deefgea piscis TaxID=2739061 RepID=A0A6M8STT4_9NEIS|nr:hypothetical protein [Deefgea piscis]QKJ65257.1 hypothetical protein HQN60_00055 [Deefgea piscis]
MANMYKDPTFDIVAGREAAAQRRQRLESEWQERQAVRRADPAYRAMKARRIQRLVRLALAGKLKRTER